MKRPDPLALHGGPRTVTREFPWPIYDETDVEAVAEVVRRGRWGNPDCGDEVARFEEEFAAYCGTRYAISCVNGSVSLRLALMAAGVGPGDEVIVPPYTFIATASTVIETNAVPVFADLDPDTYNLDPAAVEAAITPRTRAIVPVHFAGQACPMDELAALARRYGLRLIEDAAHGHGAEYRGRRLGSLAEAGSFSFQSSKNLTSGEGGMVTTSDDERAALVRSLRNVGRVEGGAWYEHVNPGCNYRLTPMQAVLLSAQLRRLDAQTRTRDENGRYLNELLAEIEGIRPLPRPDYATRHCQHLYIFRYDAAAFGGLPKDEFVRRLAAEGVPCSGGYPHPLYRQPLFQQRNFRHYALPETTDYAGVRCPVAEQACTEAVWILQQALLGTRQDMDSFAQAIRKVSFFN
jgi:dTDP-4-amino-4,6-dideoxygalactose transaminase